MTVINDDVLEKGRDLPEEHFYTVYRAALSALCHQHGGEFFVKDSDFVTVPGSLMHRVEADGIRFRWVPDGDKPQ